MIDLENEKKLILRVKKIEGQVRGINNMIQNHEYCIDIITQITAARRALEKVALVLIQNHMETCMKESMGKKQEQAKVKEMIRTLDRFLG